jgi:hypothetical protein
MQIPPWIENAKYFTSVTYSTWFNRLYNIAISRFEWLNLPDTCNEKFIEQVLFFNGFMVGYKDTALNSFLIMPCTNNSVLDIFGYPAKVNAYGYNGYMAQNLTPYTITLGQEPTRADAALLYANYSRCPDLPAVLYFARKLTKIDRTIDVNINVQKTPYIISCGENQRLTVANMFKQVDNFEPAIITTKFYGLNGEKPINVMDLKPPFVADKMQILKRQVYQEALTYLGIEANTSEKAERQVTEELTANMGETESMRQSPLASRKHFCKEFNKIYGTNIDVKFRSDLQLSQIMENGGLTDGELYDDDKNNL